jgi:Leucine rich repeat variant
MSILPPTVIQALQEAELIQKHDRLCELAAIDAIPIELVQILTLSNQISLAKQSTTAERILIHLATNKNKEIRLSVFKNSNITMAVLRILSEDEDRQIRRLFRVHPNNPNRRSHNSPWQLRKLAQDENYLVRAQVARNPDPPIDVLAFLASDLVYQVRAEVARNPVTPVDVLDILADDPYCYEYRDNCLTYTIREAVAGNKATPAYILRKLSRDPSCSHLVGRNLNTPIDILEEFVENNNSDAIRGMASNPSTPGHLLAKIVSLYPHDIQDIILPVSKHLNTSALTLAVLSTYNDNNAHYVRVGVASNLNTSPEILINLARDTYIPRYQGFDRYAIKIAVASNPSTPVHILELLWDSKDIFICQALAKNPRIPINLLRNISETKKYLFMSHISGDYNDIRFKSISSLDNKKYLLKDIQIALCSNPQTPSDILEKLADYQRYRYDLFSIAYHKSISVFVLEKLSQLKASSKIRKAAQARLRSIHRELAANPEASTEQLWQMLYHRDIEIRLAVLLHPQGLNLLLDRALQVENSLNRFIAGLHPQLSAVQRDRLFYSDNWLDRLAIACNPLTSIEQLQILSQDTHDLIRDIASQKIID